MNSVRLLIVEDEPAEITTWQKQIERNNELKKRKDVADYATSFAEAMEHIGAGKYDAAIVDIRLKSSEGVLDANASGNDVRDLLINSEIVLIAHLTGEPNAVTSGDQHYVELVRVFKKADVNEIEGPEVDVPVHQEILEWLESKSSIVETMRVVKSNIASKMAELFYSSIWPRWEGWHAVHEVTEGVNFVSSSITRHITSHLYSRFLEDSGGRVHPEEWYFQPASKDRFHTGDIIKQGEEYYVLVTPRCDLERIGGDDTLLFAKLEIAKDWAKDKKEVDDKIAALRDSLAQEFDLEKKAKLQKKIDSAYSEFRRNYYGHKKEKAAFHFLPEVNEASTITHGPFFVVFSNIKSVVVSSDEAKELAGQKIAALSPEFVPALVQRLGTFISRIGSPDYSHFP
jgi:CheY-like chemotaxis protein